MQKQISYSCTKTEDGRLATFKNWHRSNPTPLLLSQCGFYFKQNGDEVQCCDCLMKIKHWSDKDHPLIEHYKTNKRCLFVQKYRKLINAMGCKLGDNQHVEERCKTLKGNSLKQDIRSLINAGFHMIDEKWKCFSCGVEIEDWYKCDIPVMEHYIKSPNCQFIQPFIIEVKSTGNLHNYNNTGVGTVKNTSNETSGEYLVPKQEIHSTTSTSKVLDYNTSKDNSLPLCNPNASTIKEKDFPVVKDYYKKSKQDFPSHEELCLPLKEVFHQKNVEDFFPNSRKENNFYSQDNLFLKKTENQSSSDFAVCKICLDNEVRITFQPCGHFATCSVCSEKVVECPICRRKIEGRITCFLA